MSAKRAKPPKPKKPRLTDDDFDLEDADGQNPAVQHLAHALFSGVLSGAEVTGLPRGEQLLGAAAALVMLAKYHGAERKSLMGMVSVCWDGVIPVPPGGAGKA